MQSESNGQSGPQKPRTKNWVSQSERTSKSNKKLLNSVDQLKHLVERYPGEKIHRTDVPSRAFQLIKSKDEGWATKANLHVLIHLFRTVALRYKVGAEVELEAAWKGFLKILAEAGLSWVRDWNNEAHRQVFFWQLAGHVSSTILPIPEEILKNGRSQSPNGVWGYVIDQQFIAHPKDRLPVPTFLCPGDTWDGNVVLSYTVKNMLCEIANFEHGLKMVLRKKPVE